MGYTVTLLTMISIKIVKSEVIMALMITMNIVSNFSNPILSTVVVHFSGVLKYFFCIFLSSPISAILIIAILIPNLYGDFFLMAIENLTSLRGLLNILTPDFSTMNFSTMNFSTMNFSTMNFLTMNISTLK